MIIFFKKKLNLGRENWYGISLLEIGMKWDFFFILKKGWILEGKTDMEFHERI